MKKVILSLTTVFALMTSSCGGGDSNKESTSKEVRKEESSFKEVIIHTERGKHIWMTENLDVVTFRNGDTIPHVKNTKEWAKAGGYKKQPAWCYYDNDPANGEKYGKLYNWYAVNDPRGLAPKGWRIPTDREWQSLTNVPVEKMKGTRDWKKNDGKGTNESGFSALPGGGRDYKGDFINMGVTGIWWSSMEHGHNGSHAFYGALFYDNGYVLGTGTMKKGGGFSVRCVRE